MTVKHDASLSGQGMGYKVKYQTRPREYFTVYTKLTLNTEKKSIYWVFEATNYNLMWESLFKIKKWSSLGNFGNQ